MRELLETITNSGKVISDSTLADWKNKYPFLLLELVDIYNANTFYFYSAIVSSEQFYNFFNGSRPYTRFYGTDDSKNYILYKERDGSLLVAKGSSSTLKIYGMIL